MIHFKNAEYPSWDQLKQFGLQKTITSPEDFAKALKQGVEDALTMLRELDVFSPTPELLEDLHDAIFGEILDDYGSILHDLIPEVPRNAHLLQERQNIIDDLQVNAFNVHGLLNEGSIKRQTQMIADCNFTLVDIAPFPEIEGTNFINRTVAAVIMEAQLEGCFTKELIKREIDATLYEKALKGGHDFRAGTALQGMVKDLGGPMADVVNMQKWSESRQQRQEHSK